MGGESDFRFELNDSAMATEKLAEGIRSFVTDQIKLRPGLEISLNCSMTKHNAK